MRKALGVFAVLIFGAMTLAAQDSETHMPVTLGLKVGVPVTQMFSASNTNSLISPSVPGSNYSAHLPRYEFGVSGEFRLPYHLRFEIDGLYKRAGFNSYRLFGSGPGMAYNPTTFNQWEIPGLFKYNISLGHFRPFVDFGASLRHISTIDQNTYAGLAISPIRTDNSMALHNRNTYGGVAGFGFTFKKGPLELTPEARYTRWANESFQTNGLRTNLDQGDILLGISF